MEIKPTHYKHTPKSKWSVWPKDANILITKSDMDVWHIRDNVIPFAISIPKSIHAVRFSDSTVWDCTNKWNNVNIPWPNTSRTPLQVAVSQRNFRKGALKNYINNLTALTNQCANDRGQEYLPILSRLDKLKTQMDALIDLAYESQRKQHPPKRSPKSKLSPPT